MPTKGMAGAASISVNIKSGTNSVHGTLFEYNTNNALTTRAFFLPGDQNKPKFIQNQFGGTIGGPIKRDKLFYFLSWEATLESRLADNNAQPLHGADRSHPLRRYVGIDDADL